MRRVPCWIPIVAIAILALNGDLPARADLVCPGCEAAAPLGVTEVVRLAFQTVFQKGISVLLLSAAAIVSLPWILAGVGVAVFYIPRWLKRSA